MSVVNFEYSYHTLPEYFYSEIKPSAWPRAKLLLFNTALADSIGLNINHLADEQRLAILLGHNLKANAKPLAQAYAGHQFGYFTNLGDGRAFLLGEHITANKERIDLHLKGAGKTPYARAGDGFAVLGPMLREYVVSEAMYALNVPTTRSLAVITTGESVWRGVMKPGAILVRVAQSHIRVGTFEYAARCGLSALKSLFDYTMTRHYPQLVNAANPALALLDKLVNKLAHLVVDWQGVGFIHGVMNTDNTALSGETLDYGPCAFMDNYSANCVFSSIDREGRYAFANQPIVMQWNLARLAETLLPLIDTNEKNAINAAEKTLAQFSEIYQTAWLNMMRKKLGFIDATENDKKIIETLLYIMQANELDYSKTFFDLTYNKDYLTNLAIPELLQWIQQWQIRRDEKNHANEQQLAQLSLMKESNPVVIPRNHLLERALLAAEEKSDISLIRSMLTALATPYENKKESLAYQIPPKPDERIRQTFCGT